MQDWFGMSYVLIVEMIMQLNTFIKHVYILKISEFYVSFISIMLILKVLVVFDTEICTKNKSYYPSIIIENVQCTINVSIPCPILIF